MGRGPSRPAWTHPTARRHRAPGTTSVTFPGDGHDLPVVRGPHRQVRRAAAERRARVGLGGQGPGRRSRPPAPVPPAAIEKAINKAGYEIGHTPWLVSDPRIWATAGIGVLLVAAVAVMAQVTGLGDLASGAGDLSQGGLVVALLLGLAAGVSTCMALVGGLVLGLSAAFASGRPDLRRSPRRCARPRSSSAGRIVGYAVFGAVLGAIGASITMPPMLTAVLMITVAVVMLLLGTRLTGLSPQARRLVADPADGPRAAGSASADGGAGAYSDTRAGLLGAASFFLPCGFTQADPDLRPLDGLPAVRGGAPRHLRRSARRPGSSPSPACRSSSRAGPSPRCCASSASS